MANKRIKISELPRITYVPDATGTTLTTTENDYLPVAVTDRNNATVKTTMTITTRELMRFVLQQDAPLADGTDNSYTGDKLVIGRTGVKVEIVSLDVGDLVVTGTSSFGTAEYTNLVVDNVLTINSGPLKVGSSIFPSLLYNRDNKSKTLTNGIFVSNTNGVMDGFGLALSALVAAEPFTSGGNRDRLLSVASSGHIKYTTLGSVLGATNALESSPYSNAGNLLYIGGNGELKLTSGIQQQHARDVIQSVSATLVPSDSDDEHPIVASTTETLTSAELATQVTYTFSEAALTGAAVAVNDSADFKRSVFTSPLVLAGRHTNGVDLTEQTVSQTVPARVGEIRWNIYNDIPTLYLAVSADALAGTGGVHARAKVWYGVPLFGTIDDDTSDTLPITAHTYTNDD